MIFPPSFKLYDLSLERTVRCKGSQKKENQISRQTFIGIDLAH